jgi:hypothetical protein
VQSNHGHAELDNDGVLMGRAEDVDLSDDTDTITVLLTKRLVPDTDPILDDENRKVSDMVGGYGIIQALLTDTRTSCLVNSK